MAIFRFIALALLPAASAHFGVLAPALLPRHHDARAPLSLGLVIPGDSVAEAILVDGTVNFLSLYSGIITFRILLSWVPQAQGIALLRPVFTVSDVYLNLFRGVIPAIGGLDISPIAAFFVLNLLTSSVASLGAPLVPGAAQPRRPTLADRAQGAIAAGRKAWAERLRPL